MQLKNARLTRIEQYAWFGTAILTFLLLATYNFMRGSQWYLDALITTTLLVILFFVNRWVLIGKTGLSLVFLALATHNMGSFGWYEFTFTLNGLVFGYDNIQHVFSSLVVAYVAFHFINRKLHIKKSQYVEKTAIDEHKLVLIFLVLSIASLGGVLVELGEFGGYIFLGEGEGVLFAGSGDSDTLYGGDGNYVDTMTDILFNLIGSVLGTFLYYFATYQKQELHAYAK